MHAKHHDAGKGLPSPAGGRLYGILVTVLLILALTATGAVAQIEPTPTDTCPAGTSRPVVDAACVSDLAVDAPPDDPTPTVTPTEIAETGDESLAPDTAGLQEAPDSTDLQEAPASPPASLSLQDDTGNPPPPIAASLTITVWQCLAPAFDPGNLEAIDTNDLPQITSEFEACTPNLTGVQFTIAPVSSGATPKQGWSAGNPAKVNLPSVWMGENAITQQVPYNFTSTPVVLCRSNLAAEQRMEPAGPSVTWMFQQNEAVTCDWYTYQAGAPGKIVILLRQCHSDTLNTNDLAALRATCSEIFGGYPINVTPAATSITVAGGTNAGGIAEFTGLIPGAYLVAQHDEGAFRFPAVFCRQTTPGQPGPLGLRLQRTVDARGTTISVQLASNSTIFCEWFVNKAGFTFPSTVIDTVTGNLPDVALQPALIDEEKAAAGSVVINLHGCPASTSLASSSATALGTQCLDVLPGVTFSLTGAGAKPLTAATSGDFASIVSFDAVPAGSVNVVVTLPEGYASSQVYCGGGEGISRRGNAASGMILSSDGSVQLSVTAGQAVLCDWYAIPG